MSQGWKKIQATLLARARAEKKAVEEARKASTMDKGTTTASPSAPSALPAIPALSTPSTPSTSRSRTGGTDPVGLLAAHGRRGRHGPDAVVQAPVSNIMRKPWLKKMPDIVAKKEAASCPLSRSPPEGKISDGTSESFSSGTDSGSGSDSSSSNNSSNTTVILQDPEIAILEADPEE
jgi:hypothetical protein